VIIKTTNGGSSWQMLAGGGAYERYHGLYFIDNQTGYVAGYDQTNGLTIRKTTNGGISWSHYPVNHWYYYAMKVGIDFVNQNTGYAVGYKYLGNSGQVFILKTTNAGSNWNTLLPVSGQLPDYNFMDMDLKFLVSHQIGYIVGGLGKIAKTTDGGTTWNFLNKGTEANFYAIDFPETDQIGYAVGDSGYILKTTDSGTNWVRQFTGSGLSFYDVDFINNQFGFAVGARGVCFKTTNGGATWIPKNSNTTENLCAVKVIDAQVAYIGGGTGAISGGG